MERGPGQAVTDVVFVFLLVSGTETVRHGTGSEEDHVSWLASAGGEFLKHV